MGRHNSVKLAQIRQTLPPLDTAAACAQKLKEAMFDGITEHDMSDIIKGIVKKAKEGDLKATKVLFDTVLKAQAAPPPAYRMINPPPQTNGNGHPALTAGDKRAICVGCAQALGKEGPLNVEDLADETEFTEEEIAQALEDDLMGAWFEHQDNGTIRLTSVGRKEAGLDVREEDK